MPLIIPRHRKNLVINEFLRLSQAYIFENCSLDSRLALVAHLDWMKQQQDDLLVACRFQTSVDRRTTSMYFEASFVQQKRESENGS